MRYLILFIIGIIAGGALCFYFVVGAPRIHQSPPGAPLAAPSSGGDAPGTIILSLNEAFFNTFLGAMFRDLNSPSFRLASDSGNGTAANGMAQSGNCPSQVTIAPQGDGVSTAVSLANGNINAPLAFTGSYNVPIAGCVNYNGWAQTSIQLSFNQEKQVLFGNLKVEGVNIQNAPPVIGDVLTGFVQQRINERINPLQVLRASQLALALPMEASKGTLMAHVKDVRSEVKDRALLLHITYDFSGQPQ